MDILSELVRLEVMYVRDIFYRDRDGILAARPTEDGEPDGFAHYNYFTPAYVLARLSRLDRPDNPFFNDERLASDATALTDKWADTWDVRRAAGMKAHSAEWPPLIAALNLDLLGDAIGESRRGRWIDFIERWADLALERPYGFTSPNHEAWRQVALFRAGEILGRSDWKSAAHDFCRRELKYQTAEGFWEEGPGFGPSMKYNHLMLSPLAWMFRLTGDEAIGAAAGRLAEFMAKYSFPDGTTVGAFDGRQSTSPGFFAPVCPGLELHPCGRTLNARGLQLWKDVGMADDPVFFTASPWYAHFGNFFLADAFDYYEAFGTEDDFDASEALPVDGPAVLENRSSAFDGVMVRRGAWVGAVSGQNTVAPLRAPSVFELERQSRIEIWHESARLLVGGGHSSVLSEYPLANAILDTGWAGETSFGKVGADADRRRRSYYVPHGVESSARDDGWSLSLVFAHGTVDFDGVFESDEACRIDAAWDVRRVKRLHVQIPAIVWRGATLAADGTPVGESFASTPADRSVAIEGGPFSSRVVFEVPERSRVNYPLDILREYVREVHCPDRNRPPFRIATICRMIENPPERGTLTFRIRVG